MRRGGRGDRSRAVDRGDEDLGGGGVAEGDGPVGDADDQGARFGAVLGELALGAEVEATFAQVTEKGGVLIDHPDELETVAPG